MDLGYSNRTKELMARVSAFMDEHIYPNESRFEDEVAQGDRWQPLALMEELKRKAQAQGLWNLFLPREERGTGLSNYEYAPLAEIMGHVEWASEAFNCSAPDTGNMEVLLRYGTEEQKREWLEPLLAGRDPLRLRDDRAGRRIVGRDQHRQLDPARWRPLRSGWSQMVGDWRHRSPLQAPHLHGQDRSGRAAPRTAVDDPGADRCARRQRRASPAGVRLRPRAARSRRDHLRAGARAGRQSAAGRRTRLRDRARPARTRPGASLHAVDRAGGACVGDDVPPHTRARDVRQADRGANGDVGAHRRSAHPHRSGAAAGAANCAHDGQRRETRSPPSRSR